MNTGKKTKNEIDPVALAAAARIVEWAHGEAVGIVNNYEEHYPNGDGVKHVIFRSETGREFDLVLAWPAEVTP